ncbi:unnamed protein product [Amaranthus hypochondriacus]
MVNTVGSSGLSSRALVTARHKWEERAWKVENGGSEAVRVPLAGLAELWVDFIFSIAVAGKRKSFSRSLGAAAAAAVMSGCSGASGISILMRVERTLVRSRKGRTEIEWAPLQISAQELMKCHVEDPSKTAWLKAHPIASPSRSLVSCSNVQKETIS